MIKHFAQLNNPPNTSVIMLRVVRRRYYYHNGEIRWRLFKFASGYRGYRGSGHVCNDNPIYTQDKLNSHQSQERNNKNVCLEVC